MRGMMTKEERAVFESACKELADDPKHEEYHVVNQAEVDRLMHDHTIGCSEIRNIALRNGWIVKAGRA
jgi:hypothetical protein